MNQESLNFVPRYYSMDQNAITFNAMMDSRYLLVPIVDEDEGGIVAYAVSQDHADALVKRLNKT